MMNRNRALGRRWSAASFACPLLLLLIATPLFGSASPWAQTLATLDEEGPAYQDVPVPLTESPRETLQSFLALRDAMEVAILRYRQEDRSASGVERIQLITEQLRSLLDLSAVPAAERRFLGAATVYALFDIFGRLDPIDLATVPDGAAFDASGAAYWRVPETPLRIVRIEAGERAGEFVFGPRTPRVAPLFLRGIEQMPLATRLGGESWSRAGAQLTGPLIPPEVVDSLPTLLRQPTLDTPNWKNLVFLGLVALTAAVLLAVRRWIRRRQIQHPVWAIAARITIPATILAVSTLISPLVFYQLILTGQEFFLTLRFLLVVNFLAGAWLFWLTARLIAEWIIYSPAIREGTLDANLVRLVAALVGIAGIIVILAAGAQAMGMPVLSLLAGLGIGGLAVALAIRPTLENLIGGLILYIDRPVRIGDYCTFGTDSGTIENIGVRSTEIRALDRTLISIPNAQFVDMKLVNWAQCDHMLISAVIGLRFETTPDQMRYVLARIREMAHAHPRIDPETIRIRYIGPGASSRDIDIRIYAVTREWNDFYAIREDIFLRIDVIVEEAGSGYAFPSQTVYMRRDDGLDTARQDEATSAVDRWRKSGRLPFPRLAKAEIDRLEGTLDYPPQGSVERRLDGDTEEMRTAEPLSAAPPDPGPGDEATAEPARDTATAPQR